MNWRGWKLVGLWCFRFGQPSNSVVTRLWSFGVWRRAVYVALWFISRRCQHTDYVTSNHRLICKWRIGKYVEGCGLALIRGTIPAFFWRAWGKPQYIGQNNVCPSRDSNRAHHTESCRYTNPLSLCNLLRYTSSLFNDVAFKSSHVPWNDQMIMNNES
jgi:hypothetical protein